ncbi:hypothetical protein CEP54_007569 [Fusarium duplospermum]|uniref:Serine aminopeptidase S33 domain-containing protein n=1 Tax=Fusarium duplospermum TaxID=1325734 RepID=A0A428Q0M5_9HYPO|nr:hypothetical protein CEP54_007569 [Fusarium duplospermum]
MLLFFTLLLGVVTVHAARPQHASNFPVSAEDAAKYDCGPACWQILQETNAGDLAIFDMPFDYDFYETAKNFSVSKPGDLLKLKPIPADNLTVPIGTAVYKIQYMSLDLDNKTTVPATAFIAVPFVRGRDPFNVIAYAHGTTGMFRGCAPSTSSFFFDYDSWTPLIHAGYAVVATDYAGLGNNQTAHKYISSAAQANDVLYSVIAARKAFPLDLSKKWASIGHSQGGGASWKLSEHTKVQDDKAGYLGGVSIAPITYIYDAFIHGLEKLESLPEDEVQSFLIITLLPSLFFAVKAVFPDYTAPFLSETMKKRIKLGEVAQLCDNALSGLVGDLGLSQLLGSTHPSKDTDFKEFQKLNAPAQGAKTSKPLLVIQGEGDTIVFADITETAYNNSVSAGNMLQLSLYPALDHTAVVGASAPEWLAFLEGLFNGQTIKRSAIEKKVAFDIDNASKPPDV